MSSVILFFKVESSTILRLMAVIMRYDIGFAFRCALSLTLQSRRGRVYTQKVYYKWILLPPGHILEGVVIP